VIKMEKDSEKLHKLQVNLTAGALKTIDEMRKRDATTRTQIIKSSLKYYKFITEEQDKDKELKILLKSKGKTRELVIP